MIMQIRVIATPMSNGIVVRGQRSVLDHTRQSVLRAALHVSVDNPGYSGLRYKMVKTISLVRDDQKVPAVAGNNSLHLL